MEFEATIMGHKVAFRTWTYGQKQDAIRRATSWRKESDGGLVPDVDPWLLNDLMLAATVAEWDLKGLDGSPLPVTVESIRGIEPPELVEQIIEFTQRLNGVTREERKKS
jgi:hypothetical protein